MGWTIFFIVLAVLCLILLLPVRVRFAVHGRKKWQLRIYYACFRVLEKSHDAESAALPDTPAPPTEDDIVDEEDMLFLGSGDPPPVTSDSATSTEVKAAPQAALPDDEDDESFFTGEQAAAEGSKAPTNDEKPEKKSLLERVKPQGIAQWKELIDDALASLSPPLRFLLRHVYVRKLYVGITVGTKDAARTAILYGAVCSVIYRALGKLQCHISVKSEAIRIRSDFFSGFCTAQCSGELRVTPMTAFGLGLGIAIPFLWRTLWRVRRQEKQKRQEDAESAPLPAA